MVRYQKVTTNINEPCSVKRELNAFVKSIDPSQTAQSTQSDLSPNFLFAFETFSACGRTSVPREYIGP